MSNYDLKAISDKGGAKVIFNLNLVLDGALHIHPDLLYDSFRPIFEGIVKSHKLPAKLSYDLDDGKIKGHLPKMYRLNKENWSKVERLFRDRQLEQINVGVYDRNGHIRFSYTLDDKKYCKNDNWELESLNMCTLDVGFEIDLLDRNIQEIITSLGRVLFQQYTGIVGGINLSFSFDFPETDYETLLILGGWEHMFPKMKYQIRGYFWGNYLSAHHVEILGGKDSFFQRAPEVFYKVEDLGDGRVYLQLTEDIIEVSPDDLRRCREFLRDILPKAPYAISGFVPATIERLSPEQQREFLKKEGFNQRYVHLLEFKEFKEGLLEIKNPDPREEA